MSQSMRVRVGVAWKDGWRAVVDLNGELYESGERFATEADAEKKAEEISQSLRARLGAAK